VSGRLTILAALSLGSMMAQTATVRVRVVNSLTGGAIVSANVTLSSEQGGQVYGRTDAGGTFEGRVSGRVMLIVTKKGYRMTGGGMVGRMVDAKDGAEIKAEMLPLGILTGRVLDQYGDPVRGAIVRTEDRRSDPSYGEYYDGPSAATSDDRGEYRMTEVEPGMHFIAVEYSSADLDRFAPARSRFTWPHVGGVLIYPNATRIADGQQVEAIAGVATRLNDVRLTITPALTVSGRIVPPPASKSMVDCRRLELITLHSFPLVGGGQVAEDGSFKFEVPAGSYSIMARDQNGRVSKPQILDVRADIRNLQFELTTMFHVMGRLVVDGTERLDFSKVSLNFRGPPVPLDSNGGFQTNLSAARAGFMLQGLPAGWYVKDVTVAGRHIAGRHFELEAGNTEVVFTLSPRGARVEITIEGAASPLDVAMVALIPEGGQLPDPESMVGVQRDPSGRFVASGVPPGSYRVFTLDVSNWAWLYQPDQLLEKHRNRALLISVAEGERKAVVAPVVKIPPE
jgi:hypothetical protein